MPTRAITAPMINPIQAGLVGSWERARRESANVGSRNLVTASSMPGICSTPPTAASTARLPIANFIGHSRSAMK